MVHKLERWTRRIWKKMSKFYLFLRSTKIAEIFTRHCAYVGECVVKISRKIVHKQQRYGPSKLGGGRNFYLRHTVYCFKFCSLFFSFSGLFTLCVNRCHQKPNSVTLQVQNVSEM